MLRAEEVGAEEVSCPSGHVFCFGCGGSVHHPVGCDLMRLWIRKQKADSQNAKWMDKNAKVSTGLRCLYCVSVVHFFDTFVVLKYVFTSTSVICLIRKFVSFLF